jgi:hypothetical protein
MANLFHSVASGFEPVNRNDTLQLMDGFRYKIIDILMIYSVSYCVGM